MKEEAGAALNVVVFALVAAMPIWFLSDWLHHSITYWLWGPIFGTGVAYVCSWDDGALDSDEAEVRRNWTRGVVMGALHLVIMTVLWALIEKYSFIDLVYK